MAAAQVLPADQPGGTTTLAHAGIGGDPLEVACERVVVTVDGQQLPSASGRASPTRSPLSPGGGVPPLDGCEAAAADGELTPKATDAPTAAAVLPPPRWSLRLLRPSLRSWAEAASLLAWAFTGVAFVVTKQAFADASPFVFQALRFSVAAAFLALLYRSEGLRFRSHWRGSLVVGFCLTAGYLFQSAALLRTSASRTAFLTALCVPLTPLFECILVTRTLPSRAVVLSIALAVAGTYLLTAGSGSDGSWGTGDWLMIGCACFFAFHFLALNHFGREPGAFKTLAVGQCAVGTLLSWAVIPLDLPPFVRPSAYLYGGVLATGIFATGGAFALLSWAQQHVSASRTAIICAVEPLFAALAAFMVLGEGLSSAACGGGALIVAAVVASEVRCDVSGPPPSWLPAPAARLWLAAGAIQQRCTGPAVVPAAVESGATDVR